MVRVKESLNEKQIDLLIEELSNLRDSAKDRSYDLAEDKAVSRIYTGKADGFDVAISLIKAMVGENDEKAADLQD